MKSIVELLEKITIKPENSRDYLGASVIGAQCSRQIWYEYTQQQKNPVTVRQSLIYKCGSYLETMLFKELQKIIALHETGYSLQTCDETLSDKVLPVIKAHCDALLYKDNKPFAVVEFKTANAQSYNKFVKDGLRLWNPQYYTQVQTYMYLTKIPRAFIICYNKNTSEIHEEYTELDKKFYEFTRFRIKQLIEKNTIPPRINDSPVYYLCKMCNYRSICHE